MSEECNCEQALKLIIENERMRTGLEALLDEERDPISKRFLMLLLDIVEVNNE